MSVLCNDFDISPFSLSEIITKSFWWSGLGCLMLIASGFLHSSNSLSLIKKSSVFGTVCSGIFGIFTWGVVSKIGSGLIFLKTVSLSCCYTWGSKLKNLSAVFLKIWSLAFNLSSIKSPGVG